MNEERSNREITERGTLLDRNFLKYNSSAALANFVQPIFTLFLTLLAHEMHASILEVGLVGGASSGVYAFMPFIMGRFSDRGEARRFLIIVALALLGCVSVLYYFAQNPVDLIVLRIFEGMGWAAFWPSIDSAISHDTKVDPKRALAAFNLSWSSTSALGPFIGSFVVVAFSLRQVFIFNSLFLIVALGLNLIPRSTSDRILERSGVKQPHNSAAENVGKVDDVSGPSFTPLRISPLFYILSLAVSTLASNTMQTFLSSYASSQGIPIITIGAISLTYGAMRFLGYLLTTNERIRHYLLGPKTRIRNVFLLIVTVAFSPLLMLVHNESGAMYFLSFGLTGLSYAFVYFIVMIAFLAETSKEKMGAGAGIFENSIGLGAFAGPVIAGVVAGNSLTVPFAVPSASALVMLPILFFLRKSAKKR
jgi:MFS family permease